MAETITITFPAWVAYWVALYCLLNLVQSSLYFYNCYLQKQINKLTKEQSNG